MSVTVVAAVPPVGAPRVPVSVDAPASTVEITGRGWMASAPLVTCWAVPVNAEVADPFRAPECRWCPCNRGVEYASVAGDAVLLKAWRVATLDRAAAAVIAAVRGEVAA